MRLIRGSDRLGAECTDAVVRKLRRRFHCGTRGIRSGVPHPRSRPVTWMRVGAGRTKTLLRGTSEQPPPVRFKVSIGRGLTLARPTEAAAPRLKLVRSTPSWPG